MISDFDVLDRQFESGSQGRRMVRLHLEVSALEGRESSRRKVGSRSELRLSKTNAHAKVEQLQLGVVKRDELSDRNAENLGHARQSVHLRGHLTHLPRPNGTHADIRKTCDFTPGKSGIGSGTQQPLGIESPEDLAAHARSLVSRAPFTRSHCAALASLVVSMMFYIDTVDRRSLALKVQ